MPGHEKKVKQSYDECSAFVQYVRIRCTLPEKKKEEFTSEGAALDWSRREKKQKSS